ncbi:MAG: hypothetical protein R6U65_05875, partial [Perlabentimonas sp.]
MTFFLFLVTKTYSQTSTPPAAGDGTEADPYQIETLDNLYWLSQSDTEWDKHYIQTADIDASASSTWDDGAGFTPIGTVDIRFSGKYDGNGHVVSGITISRPGSNFIGFFGVNSSESEITNLGVTSVNITGQQRVGGFIGGSASSSTIKNCFSSGIVVGIGSGSY